MPITQDDRILSIATPLGKDFLLIDSFVVKEAISNLFTIEVELRHEEASETGPPTEVDPVKLLGKSITIAVAQRDDTIRHFNGIVNRFTQLNRDVRFTYYRMELVPQLWLLTKIKQSRIFQEKNVPDIVKEVLGGVEHKFELQGTYEPRNYCVQYRESDFDFISRLMEEEGIYYFFEHTSETHRMIIANTPSSHRDCPITSTLEFAEEITSEMFVPSVKRWDLNFELQSGKVVFWDHKFELPKKKLDAEKQSRFTVGNNTKLEVYDFPGGYARKYDGIDKGGGERASDLQKIFQDNTKKAEVALDGLDVKYRTMIGESDCAALTSGHRFKLENHPMNSQNGQYVLTRISHRAVQSPDYASDAFVGSPYSNQFECIPYGAGAPPFRPQLKTPKPIVRGSQTAIVVGPSGEEIFTDKYGRVKVQFHWDRHGQYDSNSSCWVRVAQGSAGKKWGVMFIPRIGWEVVVDFLEGDPDQPIIVGSVYNAESMPPYTLPDEKTKSTIKSNSSKGGGGFNELRFEDKAGSEQIFFHAQKDQDIRVKNDCKEMIEHDRHLIVKNDQYEQVKKDKYLQVTGNQTEKVDGNVHLKVGSNKEQKVGSKYAVDSGMEVHLKGGTSVTIEAGASLTLKVGGNFVNINSGGVFVKGSMVMINSGGAAGSGGGASPDTPKDPKEAEVGESGQRVDLRPESKPPPQPPNLKVLAQAAQQQAASPAAPSVGQAIQAMEGVGQQAANMAASRAGRNSLYVDKRTVTMDDQTLRQHLFTDSTRLFAVLDGIMVPDLPNRLYNAEVQNYCLLTGDLTPDLVYAAPYLVYLSQDSKFTDWILAEALGKHWGIFAQTPHSIIEMRRHFQGLMNCYDERGNPIKFRYYDPRVLRKFLPTCNGGELKTLFGKTEALFAESESGDGIVRYKITDDKLESVELN